MNKRISDSGRILATVRSFKLKCSVSLRWGPLRIYGELLHPCCDLSFVSADSTPPGKEGINEREETCSEEKDSCERLLRCRTLTNPLGRRWRNMLTALMGRLNAGTVFIIRMGIVVIQL